MSKTKKKVPGWLVVVAVVALILMLRDKANQELPSGDNALDEGKQTVTQSERDKILAAVPEHLHSNYFLVDKSAGCCKTLSGRVAVMVVLVSDSVSTWDETSVSTLKEEFNTYAQDIMAEAASYNTEVSFSFHYYHTKLTGDVASGDYSNDWQDPALSGAGLPALSKMHTYATERNNAKEAPVVFAFNKKGRSYASSGKNEFMVLYSDKGDNTFQHELSHLFGANDFYYPDKVMELATTHLAESVMNSGAVADSLTAYVIGWTDTLSDGAKAFLEQTNDITAEYMSAEHDKQAFTGNGTKVFSNGTYIGDMVRGVRHGTGTMTYNNGGWYTGQWSNGNRTGIGSGKIVYDDGDVYEGEFLDGKRHGKGTYTYNNGSVYTGGWENGKKAGNGSGKEYYENGSYEGQFYNGKRHGQGTYTYNNGSVYTGGWANGEKSGAGTCKEYYDNGYYEGQLYNGKRHGQGTYVWNSGDRYSGQWTDGKRTGYGTYTWPDGRSKTGSWQDGKFIG